jgi:hypothetical protein
MAKKSELVSAINSYSTARATGDGNLINMSAGVLHNVLETLEFEPEEETPVSDFLFKPHKVFTQQALQHRAL